MKALEEALKTMQEKQEKLDKKIEEVYKNPEKQTRIDQLEQEQHKAYHEVQMEASTEFLKFQQEVKRILNSNEGESDKRAQISALKEKMQAQFEEAAKLCPALGKVGRIQAA